MKHWLDGSLRWRGRVMLAMTTSCLATAAWAGDGSGAAATPALGPSADQKGAVSEVVVTARRRSERAIDVPASLDVFSGAALENSGVTSLQDLQYQTPGLDIAVAGESTRISLRGVGTNIQSGAPSVAVQLDGVYIPNTQFALTEFFDLDRVEVLKGPQGDLYGRNATGGVINIVSQAPGRTPEADGWVGFGSYGLVTSQAAATVPLGDRGALRISGAYAADDGYTRNLNPAGGDVDSRGYKGVRVRGRYALTDRLSADVTLQYSKDDGTLGYGGSNDPTSPVYASAPPAQRTGPFDINVDTPPQSRKTGLLFAGTLTYDFGPAILKSITGYVDYRYRKLEDLDGSGGFIADSTTDFRTRFISQELQLSGRTSRGLTWAGGLYYSQELNRGEGVETDNDYPQVDPYVYTDVTQRIRDWSVAAYGEVTVPLTSRLSITAGGRYTIERQRGAGVFAAPLFLDAPIPTQAATRADGFAPKALVEYRPYEGGRLYASATRGFKAGGVNLGTTADTFRPEHLWAYEVGSKNRLLSGRAELGLAGFYYDYTDLQLRTALFTDEGIDIRVTNAARATIKGVELSGMYQLTPVVSVDVNGSYIDSELNRFVSPVTLTELHGIPIPLTPDLSFTAGLQVKVPLPGGADVSGRVEANHQSSVIFPQFADLDRERQGAFTLLNANLRYDFPGEHLYVQLIGRNLTDKAHLTQRFFFDGFADTEFYAPPRTLEGRVGFRF